MTETYFGTHESRERDARFVGHEWKGDKMTERVDAVEASMLIEDLNDTAHGIRLSRKAAKAIRALLAERDALIASQGYTYIGKDGKPILARDLEDHRDALEAENQRLREALASIASNTCCGRCQEAALVARAALAEQEKTDDPSMPKA